MRLKSLTVCAALALLAACESTPPPQPPEPPRAHAIDLAEQARRTFAASPASALQVVRRYRERPSPLVRDARAGWRTGRLDRVLGGDFDVISAT